MRTNYVLIDFESVQTRSLRLLTQEHFKVIVFVGANQGKLPFEVAESLQQLGSRAEYIKISGRGPNALDFHIAYYIGRLAAEEPSGLSNAPGLRARLDDPRGRGRRGFKPRRRRPRRLSAPGSRCRRVDGGSFP